MKNKVGIILNGLIKENPTFVLVLGMCPTLATTTSAINGIGMGLATAFVLIFSNMVISLIKNLVPQRSYTFVIVVIATFVTILELVMQAYYQHCTRVWGFHSPNQSTVLCLAGRGLRLQKLGLDSHSTV